MKLTVSKEEFKILLESKTLEYLDKNLYRLNIEKSTRHNVEYIKVEINIEEKNEDNTNDKTIKEEDLVVNRFHNEIPKTPEEKALIAVEEKRISIDIDVIYKAYKDAFPNNINVLLGLKTDGPSLRTGNKEKIVTKLKKRIAEGYDINDIIEAVKYEVWYRKTESLKKKDQNPTSNLEVINSLQFMQRAESWINNTENIDTMIERSKLSLEYKNSSNPAVESKNNHAQQQNQIRPKIL